MIELKDVLDRILQRLDSIDEKQSTSTEIQARHEENLKEHMRRSEILENEFKPVKRHVQQVQGGFKLFMILLTIAGVIAAWQTIK